MERDSGTAQPPNEVHNLLIHDLDIDMTHYYCTGSIESDWSVDTGGECLRPLAHTPKSRRGVRTR